MSDMRHLLAVSLRVVALVAIAQGVLALVDAASGDVVGANIGVGLASFGALALAAGFGGAVDGRFRPPVRRALVTWAVVAAVVALVLPLTAPPLERLDLSVYLDDLLVLGWFGLALVLVPAGIGVAAGSATRDWGSSPRDGTIPA